MNLMLNGSSEAFEGLLARAAATAERLQRESPLRPGGRIVTALENTREHVELVIAGWRLGLQLVAAAPTVSGPTFAGILGSTAPQAVAVDAANERLCRIVHDWTPRTCMAGDVLLGYAGTAVPGNPPARPDSLSSDWQAWLAHLPPAVFYTSGSTSTAKGVPLAWPKILAKGKAVLGFYGAAPGERVMPILPLSHVYGLYGLMGAAALGADCSVLRESSSPAAFAAALADQGATIAICPPMVGAFLFGRHGCEAAVRERLRVLAMGGAATSREQAARIVAALPRTRVYLSYGLAETYSTVCCNDVSVPGADFASVGPLRFGAFGEVRDPASGRALPDGEVGEFCIGGTIMEGYVGMPGEGFTADGLFRTGDLVRRDASGAYAVTGRLKEMINAGGLSIFPAEIEEAMKRHPAVADCGVFGERSGELEVVWAAVVLRAQAGEPERILGELYDWCRAHLATKMVPRRILAVPAIPRGALGKIARAELRKLCRSEAPALQPT